MSKRPNTLVAHVPVISKGYYDFLIDAQDTVERAFLLDETVTGVIDGIRKDIRRLHTEDTVELLSPHLTYPIRSIGHTGLRRLVEQTDDIIYAPDDEVTRYLASEYLIDDSRLYLNPVFLRWDRTNIDKDVPIVADATITPEELPEGLIARLEKELIASTDWWRQVACVLYNERSDDPIILSGHNSYIPTEDTAELDGDIRSQSQRGTTIDIANAQHAEASVIANAAKLGIKVEGAACLVSTFPCPVCAKLLVDSGISSVIYAEGYAVGDGLNVLNQAGIQVVKLDGFQASGSSRTKPVPYIR